MDRIGEEVNKWSKHISVFKFGNNLGWLISKLLNINIQGFWKSESWVRPFKSISCSVENPYSTASTYTGGLTATCDSRSKRSALSSGLLKHLHTCGIHSPRRTHDNNNKYIKSILREELFVNCLVLTRLSPGHPLWSILFKSHKI